MTDTAPEWLTLTEASRLLGVHPMTLRAWVDAGLVRAFRTPGGHRRLEASDLRSFLERRRADQNTRALTAPDLTLQQVRRQLTGQSMANSSWYLRLTETQRARQRELGQRLLGLLLQFVGRRENAEQFLEDGRALAREYGRDLAQAQLTAGELARAFIFFRRTILNVTFSSEGSGAQSDSEGVLLHQNINAFMDELLIATLDAFEEARNQSVRLIPENLQKTANNRKK